jgi:hypothetical protein
LYVNAIEHTPHTTPPLSTAQTMADEDKEKAEKVAAAKKRVSALAQYSLHIRTVAPLNKDSMSCIGMIGARAKLGHMMLTQL